MLVASRGLHKWLIGEGKGACGSGRFERESGLGNKKRETCAGGQNFKR